MIYGSKMDIPHDQLSPEALNALVEEYVTREGTDYGAEEIALKTKIAQVLAQIKAGSVIIRYDSKTQTCGLFPKE